MGIQTRVLLSTIRPGYVWLFLVIVAAMALTGAVRVEARQPAREKQVQLVSEGGLRYRHRDGVLELRSSGGWLRTAGAYLDFQLSFDYRPMTSDADTGIIVRSWVGNGAWPQVGYRIRLPRSASEDVSQMLIGRRREVAGVERGRVDLVPGDGWQRVVIEGTGPRVTVRINDTPAAVYEIGSYGGHVFFDTRRGRTEMRNIQLIDAEQPMAVPEGTVKIDKEDSLRKHPRLIEEQKPFYTTDAMAAKVEGTIVLDIAVLPDGVPVVTGVRKSLHPGLDRSAIAAVRAWRFRPGTVDGTAVPMAVEVQLSFTLR